MKFSDRELLIKIWEKVSKNEKDVAGLKTDFAELKTDVAELKTDMADVKSELAFIKDVLVGVAGDLDSHEARLRRLEAAG